MKKATTVEQQVQLLKNRGMAIADEDKAKEILADIGYYRLGFYWFPFEQTFPEKLSRRSHDFKPGTTFAQAVSLYYFDHDLRTILIKFLYRIEVNLRTKIIYNVSNLHPDNPTWFTDPSIVGKPWVDYIIASYDGIRRNEAIKIHHLKHRADTYAPAWKTLEYITMGETVELFRNLKDTVVRDQIAQSYGLRNTAIFENYIVTLRVLRNLCAHSHNVFDMRLQKSLKLGPIKQMSGSTNNLVGCLYVMHFILQAISPNRAAELRQSIRDLVETDDNRSILQVTHYLKAFYE